MATWDFAEEAVKEAGHILTTGGALLDAVEAGINLVELNTKVDSVGFGGLPNSEG